MKKKDIILISIIVILIVIIIGLLIYINHKNTSNIQENIIEAEVLATGTDYLLVTTEEEIDYVIDTKDVNYQVGDILKIELTNIKENKMPIEATANKITKIEDTTSENSVEDDQAEKITAPEENIETNQNNTSITSQTTNSQNSNTENSTEDDIIAYFSSLETKIANYKENEAIGQTIKANFITCIDFIFYEGTIDGKTFQELSDSAKIKVIEIALSIDEKIDSKFPGYKDSIASSYQNIKSKLIEKYLDVTTSICERDQDLCTSAKESFRTLKNSFNITWSIIKSLAGKGTTKLKDWYEIWRYS